MITKEKISKTEATPVQYSDATSEKHTIYEFQKEPKSKNLAPKTIESQLTEMTVSSEISNLNKSYSFAPQMSHDDFQEIQKLRKIELMKMPLHARVVERAKELFELVLAFFSGKKVRGKHMTATAKKAISQLRQIATLYSAMPHRSLEETIVFDAAFGKAYYDILYASYKASLNKQEEMNGTQDYQRAIDGFIEALG